MSTENRLRQSLADRGWLRSNQEDSARNQAADHPPVLTDVTANEPSEFRSSNYDGDHFAHDQIDREKAWDPTGRNFTYGVIGASRVISASAIRTVVIKVVAMLSASADVLAAAKTEVDLAPVALGQSITVKWRGKPIFIRHRTPEEIAAARADDKAPDLREIETDAARAQKPEYLILIGVCTHFGCIPIPNSGNYKGWFCPCHGSHYDLSGRIRLGPAPRNLEVPPHNFIGDTKVVIG